MATRTLTRRMSATPEQIWARLCERSVSDARAGLGGESSTVTIHEPSEGHLRVGIDTAIPESWMPPMVRKRLSGRTGFGVPTVRRVETWERVDTVADPDGVDIDGSMSLEIDGAPGDASCEMRVADAGAGSVIRYDLSLTVSVPLVGRAIETAVLGRIADVLEQELEILDAGV